MRISKGCLLGVSSTPESAGEQNRCNHERCRRGQAQPSFWTGTQSGCSNRGGITEREAGGSAGASEVTCSSGSAAKKVLREPARGEALPCDLCVEGSGSPCERASDPQTVCGRTLAFLAGDAPCSLMTKATTISQTAEASPSLIPFSFLPPQRNSASRSVELTERVPPSFDSARVDGKQWTLSRTFQLLPPTQTLTFVCSTHQCCRAVQVPPASACGL
ncbi:hypothetical protein MJT46_001778 [Ovis ammon polii x Ovis aries]|nr:hypothetical protein MJT46_001778 [Ovis ammon polii x Ovis aries]